MKTNVFKNGLRAMMALAAVALATTITSCSSEEFEFGTVNPVTPTTVNAKASISAVVAFDGVMLPAGEVDVTFNGASANQGDTYVLTGTPALSAQSVEVVATYKGMTAKTTVAVPALAAGEGYAATAQVFINSEDNFEAALDTDVEEIKNVVSVPAEPFVNTGTDPIQYKFWYDDVTGRKIENAVYYTEDDLIKTVLNNWNIGKIVTRKFIEVTLNPGDVFTAEVVTTETISSRMLKKLETRATEEIDEDVLATFTQTVWETEVKYNIVDASHAGHDYSHDAGHDGHGSNPNAGGGIAGAE